LNTIAHSLKSTRCRIGSQRKTSITYGGGDAVVLSLANDQSSCGVDNSSELPQVDVVYASEHCVTVGPIVDTSTSHRSHADKEPGFSIDLNFQDVMSDFQTKKIGRQRTKSGSRAVGLQDKSRKNLMQNNTYYICVTILRFTNIGRGFYTLQPC